MTNNFGQFLLQQFCTRKNTAAMAFGPLNALLVRAELFHCFRRRASERLVLVRF
jgi:cytochrome c-type biogenesis protein CcmH/NrfF